jgi:Tol biopolymer transport system component
LVYLGFDPDGRQTLTLFDFASEKTILALRAPLSEGVIYFPRFSPDGSQLAYLWQQGDPLAGMSYSIRLLNLADGVVRELVAGNVGFNVPAWSPDGAHIAYVRSDSGQAQRVVEGQLPEVESTNLWVVRLEDGVMTRVTTLAGQARSPQWANDSRTLAFITEDGQVGMASLNEPGRMWAAAGPAAFPLLSALFFVP